MGNYTMSGNGVPRSTQPDREQAHVSPFAWQRINNRIPRRATAVERYALGAAIWAMGAGLVVLLMAW